MVTRFYFDTLMAPAVSPTVDSSWEVTSPNFGRLLVDPDMKGVSAPTFSKAFTAAAAPRDIHVGSFVSDPLPAAVTVGGTMSLVINLDESVTTADCFLQVVVRVVNNAGTVVRGIAYSGQTATSVSATNTAANYELGLSDQTRYLANIALSNVGAQVGDRIVVEIGARTTQAAVSGIVILTAYASCDLSDAPLLPDRNIQSGNEMRGWIEFSADLFGSLATEQYRFRQDGLLLNGPATLPFIDITSVDGIDSAPTNSSTTDREGAHGGFVRAEFETVRTITLEGNIYANPSTMETFLDQLKDNFRPTATPHWFQFGTDAGVRLVFARSTGIRYAKNSQRNLGVQAFQVQLILADPRIYSPAEQTIRHSAASATPATYNIAGNRDTLALITLLPGTATWSDPAFTITNDYGSMTITFSGYNVNGLVDIDLDARTMLQNLVNLSVRGYATITGDWVPLAPGNNVIKVSSVAAGAQLILTYRPAWR